jgi:DNA-binding GntR family transcriptional regulator
MATKQKSAKAKPGRKKAAPAERPVSASLSEWVYGELRKKIVTGALKPGDRLREVGLATSLNVSRTPIREAIKRLESDGLLKYLPNRGAVIASLTQEQAGELYGLREILEAAAARLAAQHALDHEIQLLKDVLQRQKDAGEDPATLARLNRIFHSTIYRMSHNRYLIDVLTKAQDYMVLLRDTAYRAQGRAATAYAEHKEIVDAIGRRDPDGAEAASRRHSREAQRVRMMLEFGEQMRTSAGF